MYEKPSRSCQLLLQLLGGGGLNECLFYGVEETFFWKVRRRNVFFGRLLERETGREKTRVLLTTLFGQRRGVFFLISARRLNLFP